METTENQPVSWEHERGGASAKIANGGLPGPTHYGLTFEASETCESDNESCETRIFYGDDNVTSAGPCYEPTGEPLRAPSVPDGKRHRKIPATLLTTGNAQWLFMSKYRQTNPSNSVDETHPYISAPEPAQLRSSESSAYPSPVAFPSTQQLGTTAMPARPVQQVEAPDKPSWLKGAM